MLKVKIYRGVELLLLEHWLEQGIFHGFGNNTLSAEDARNTIPMVAGELGREDADFNYRILKQVHGTLIFEAGEIQPDSEGDGIISAPGNLESTNIAAVRTADCAPVLFFDPKTRLIAAAHCGWRGTVAGLLEKVISSLVSKGSAVGDLEIAIGPCAQVGSYEVGEEVASEFRHYGDNFVREVDGRIFADVSGLLMHQAMGAGVPEDKVFCSNINTIEDEKYFSYRRENPLSGHQVSFISDLAST